MNISLFVYNILILFFFILILPIYWLVETLCGTNSLLLMQRLGIYSSKIFNKNLNYPKVWIHASSVGEVKIACRIAEILINKFEHISLIISTYTVTGNKYARKLTCNYSSVIVIFAPVDVPFCIRHALIQIRPTIIAYIETEIWPNWINIANRLNIITMLINGRISRRSVKRYRKIKYLMKFILNKVDVFSMVSDDDKLRILSINAPAERIFVNGNIKFDFYKKDYNSNILKRVYNLYNIFNKSLVFVAGSIRSSEEFIVLNSYIKIKKFFPDIILIIAPRHLNRVLHIEKIINSKGLSSIRRSNLTIQSIRKEQIIILDTIGELMISYSIATVVFCGASLVNLGGQNIFEAAVWGKPIIHGPFMDDFKEIVDILQIYGATIKVKSGEEMTNIIIYLLHNLNYAKKMGNLAKEITLLHNGACLKHTKVIGEFIEKFN